jgi:hypothetical protein
VEFQQSHCYDLNKLETAIAKDDIGKETWIAPFSDITLETDYDKNASGWRYELIRHGAGSSDHAVFTPFAFNQFCRRLKSPAKYMLTLPGNLAKGNLDFFKEDVKDKDVAIKVKFKNDDRHPDGGFKFVRGCCSPSSPYLSNRELVSLLRPHSERVGMRVWQANIRPHDFHCKLIWGPNINIGTMRNPDNVNIGVNISSSEVGSCATEINILVFRLVCTNGMISLVDNAPLFKMKSYNISRDELSARINNAFNTLENRKDHIIGKFQDARDCKLERPFKILSRIAKKYGLSKPQIIGLTEEYNRGIVTGEYGKNRIDLVNVITRYAQKQSEESRIKMEMIAGKFLVDDEILSGPVSPEKVNKDEG